MNADREMVSEAMEQFYKDLYSAQKLSVYIAEGGVTYKRIAIKIMPNNPCFCWSGKNTRSATAVDKMRQPNIGYVSE